MADDECFSNYIPYNLLFHVLHICVDVNSIQTSIIHKVKAVLDQELKGQFFKTEKFRIRTFQVFFFFMGSQHTEVWTAIFQGVSTSLKLIFFI